MFATSHIKIIKFMFPGINIFWAQLILILAWADKWGLKWVWEEPKTYLCPWTQTVSLIYHFGGLRENNNWKNDKTKAWMIMQACKCAPF